MTRLEEIYHLPENNSSEKEEKNKDFNWLPGFEEMMACQEEDVQREPNIPNQQNVSSYRGTQIETENQPDQSMNQNMNQNMSGNMPDSSEMLPPEELQREEQIYWNDYEYFLRMLPVIAREIWVAADAILDRYEFEGSSMYAEYPDKMAIFKIVDMIYDKLKYYENNPTENRMDGSEGKNYYYVSKEAQGINTPLRDMIFVIVSWNMAFRRQRYYRRKKVFPIS